MESAEVSNNSFRKRLLASLGLGLVAAVLSVAVFLMFFAAPIRGPFAALGLACAGVFFALFTGPWALLQILMGAHGSFYAFWGVTLLILYAGAVFVQVKYLPRAVAMSLAGADLFVMIFGLWVARLIVI